MSAFTGPLAQAREYRDLLDSRDDRLSFDAALDRVERLATDMETALERCPLCTHAWRRHDPEDGKCDAGSHDFGECPCGRDPSYHRVRNAALSQLALDDGSIARAVLSAREEGADTR